MSTILTGAIILSLSGASALLWKRKIEELFGFSILLIVSLLYITGILGYLALGRYIIIGVSAIAACFCLWSFLHNDRSMFVARIFTPGLLVFVLLLMICIINYRNRLLDSYDDFSHWALEIKNLYVFNAIPNGMRETTVYFKDYPPASALFAYFWTKLSGGLNEGDMFRSLIVFSLSMLFPVFSRITWKQWQLIFPLAGICYILPLIFNTDSYCSLLVDCLLGTVVAYPVYFCYTSENRKGMYIICGAVLFILPLIKVSGFGLTILILPVLTYALFISNRVKRLLYKSGSILTLLLCSLLGKASWDWYLHVNNTSVFHTGVSLKQLYHLLLNGLQTYQIIGIETYLQKMIDPKSWSNYSQQTFLFWLFVFIILTFLGTWKNGDINKAKRDRGILLITGAIGIIYAVSLLLIYFFYFSSGEASTVTACERYLSTMLIAMFSIMLFVLYDRLISEKAAAVRYTLLLLVSMLLIINPSRLYINTVGQFELKNGAEISRENKKPSGNILDILDSQTDSVYFLTEEDNAYPYWVNRFDFTPIHLYDGQNILLDGKKDPVIINSYTRFLTVQAWEDELRKGGYTHLYIYNVNQGFIDDFGCMFTDPDDIQARTLYCIRYNGDSVMFSFASR